MVPLHSELGSRLNLPERFVKKLEVQRPGHSFKLVMAGCPYSTLVLDMLSDGEGHMFLMGGWRKFAHMHRLHPGYIILFKLKERGVL